MEKYKDNLDKGEDLSQVIGDIKNTYKEFVDERLEDSDPLKQKILDYFVNGNDVDNQYSYILSNLSDDEKRHYVYDLQDRLKDPGLFISKMERYFTTQGIYKSEKELKRNPRTATPEEYEMGVYSDFLEPQVREAVFTLNRKGYKTFQSGYSPKDPRNQFIDVYNSEVEIPEDLKEVLRLYGIETEVKNLDDRTTITLYPINTKKIIRREEWENIWNIFSEQLPKNNSRLIKRTTEPTLHRDFRLVQNLIRKRQIG